MKINAAIVRVLLTIVKYPGTGYGFDICQDSENLISFFPPLY